MHDQAIEEETEATYRVALDSAVRSLGQWEHGRRELQRKLIAKGHDRELVERGRDYLASRDLQSDARYVESYIRSRILKGYGPVKIRQELWSRGVSETELESQLTVSAEFWMQVASGAKTKKFGDETVDRDGWNVQARFLARRGFPSDLIYRVLGSHQD